MPSAKADLNQLIAEYESGLTLRQVADRHGLTFQSVAQRLARNGVKLRPAHPRKYDLIVCLTCGKQFFPLRESTRYCSQKCVPRIGVHKQTHCKNGHPLIPENLSSRYGNTPPHCKICEHARQRAYYHRKKGS